MGSLGGSIGYLIFDHEAIHVHELPNKITVNAALLFYQPFLFI